MHLARLNRLHFGAVTRMDTSLGNGSQTLDAGDASASKPTGVTQPPLTPTASPKGEQRRGEVAGEATPLMPLDGRMDFGLREPLVLPSGALPQGHLA